MASQLCSSVILVITIVLVWTVDSLTLNDFYPYGEENGDTAVTVTPATDMSVPLEQPIENFAVFKTHQLNVSNIHVYFDGFIRFESGSHYIEFNLLNRRGQGDDNLSITTYRLTNDSLLLRRAQNEINKAFPHTFCSSSPPTQLLIQTWIDYKKGPSYPGSNFQFLLVTNGFNSYGIAKFVDVNDHMDREGSMTTGVRTFLFGASETSNIVQFPFESDVYDAPTQMLNSDIPGTYLFSLNSSDGDCTGSCHCKIALVRLACEVRRRNGESLPNSCNRYD
ncbi:PREDICTED: uncharacterized protein LOC105312364 [Amphimedon queenslandica]|uniref:NIDO domain-containing protein n=1 Tax=Amphimedon queenslandica TaxID=400682 RepID=A0A1X7V5G9_AMPQE|nr:PREDICTED: uncharacterized protein LOC105312364 [Amphimedon queenslandica]XP_019850739.1 PREDICTED: uncharacterized protein LOC105312364 [Amphimedon queenslandica]|eukprot:XP_011403252.1 PREDICTED: uncharacterized protein LOC105312364 [Amphimedon queenslandica]